MPSLASWYTAFRPSVVLGTFTITFGCHWAYSRPSLIIPGASSETVSALIGPSTSVAVSLIVLLKSAPFSLASRLGLVVTPLRIPQLAASRISLIFALSRKICMTFGSFVSQSSVLICSFVMLHLPGEEYH